MITIGKCDLVVEIVVEIEVSLQEKGARTEQVEGVQRPFDQHPFLPPMSHALLQKKMFESGALTVQLEGVQRPVEHRK